MLHANEPWRAIAHLRRMVEIEELLLTHLRLLDTMSPEGFLQFRDPLDPASGFQSCSVPRHRVLQWGGQASDAHLRLLRRRTARLARRDELQRPNVWSGFEHSLRASTGAADMTTSWTSCGRCIWHHDSAPLTALHAVAELLVDHDEQLAVWRYQHMLMAGATDRASTGHGRQRGHGLPRYHDRAAFYPVLWEVRSVL